MKNIQLFEFILYVADQKRSRDFYSNILRMQPQLDVPGMTEFTLNENLKLGLMPETGIAKILEAKTPHPSSGSGIPRCELYLYVDDVEAEFINAIKGGAVVISPIEERNWGEVVGYLTDPDGHIIAFAKKK